MIPLLIKMIPENTNPFSSLKDKIFLRLYLSQTISLLGDAFTWVGVALLAFQFGDKRSSIILATALTIRVAAFIFLGPYAGVLADRLDRKKILYITHFTRMGIVACLPFISSPIQIYLLIFFLNIFNAFFTPAYRAAIPQSLKNKNHYSSGIALSNATNQLLGVLGPGLAGAVAIWLGARQIFFVDAATFVIAGVFILTLPSMLLEKGAKIKTVHPKVWSDILKGTRLLFSDKAVRFALLIELVSAIAGAQILVNTIGYIKGRLMLTDEHYGYVMSAFGIGATIAAFASGNFDKSKNRTVSLLAGGGLIGIVIAFGNFVAFFPLMVLWLLAGFAQTLTETPTQILIAEKYPKDVHGKVYGAHFAWSHLWWGIGYPIAGVTGLYFQNSAFIISAVLSIVIFLFIVIFYYPKATKHA